MSGVAADWLADPVLSAFWSTVAHRLESTGLAARGRVTVRAGSRAERHALGALLGRPVVRERVQVDLAALDARIAQRSSLSGLVEAASAQTGRQLRDRPAERADRDARREEPLLLARGLVEAPWVEEWLAGLRRTGLLSRRTDGEQTARDAATVLRAVLGPQPRPHSRTDLGAQLLGDAHALDEGRVLTQVVLRALAAADGVPTPATPAGRRELWQRHGVHGDLVSATCLVLGLRPVSPDPVSVRLRAAAGGPLHLTAWDLRDWDPTSVEPGEVLVCENPRVLEAVAASGNPLRGGVAVVCTSGEPNTVVTGVLDRLGAAGCLLAYHGDFDWPGIAIANRLVARHRMRPWLMGAADYEAGLHPRALPLGETPVEPAWDAELGAAMRGHGVAVHEEAVLDRLLDRLLEPAHRTGHWFTA